MSLLNSMLRLVGLKSQKSQLRKRPGRPIHVETLEPRQLLTVTYHGGVVIPNVHIQNVYFGSDWLSGNSTGNRLYNQTGQLEGFSKYIVGSSYMDMLNSAGYGVGRGTFSTGWIAGYNYNKNVYLNDTTIRAQLQQQILDRNSGVLGGSDPNTLYMIYIEPGVAVKLWTYTSVTSFLGYHGAFAGKSFGGSNIDIHYAVMAYPGSPNVTAQSQGFNNNFDQLTKVASHELAEAVTDPNVNYKSLTWYDDQKNGEIGDLANGYKIRLNGYCVQPEVAKNGALIYPTGYASYKFTGGTSTGFSTINTSSVIPPTPVNSTIVVSTSTPDTDKSLVTSFTTPVKKNASPAGQFAFDPTTGSFTISAA
ncbi:MAG: hypothetical protein JSS02_18220 [Planctomycetes bacterium]|nr:hypothetical protein [Planctomycetota bacterium]